MNIDYTLWPNTEGNLGNIKVQIPDGVNTFWPEGDALVGNFVYKDGKLVGFVDTKALTVNDTKSTVINYDYFDIELPFTEGEISITRGERSKYFNVRYSVSDDNNVVVTLKYKGCKTVDEVKAVDPDYKTTDIIDGVWSEGLGDLENGYNMFYNCSAITSFTSDLSNLTDGRYMFQNCKNLTSFNTDLSNLTNGLWMFLNCTALASFNSDLSSLTNGERMFHSCYKLASFNSDLSNLTNGTEMFHYCENLSEFDTDLPKLAKGWHMFKECSNLTTFSSDLSSLTDGTQMLYGCKLDAASVQYIADTINTVSSGTIHIGIGNSTPNEEEKAAFNTIASKGWTVYVNGSKYTPTSPTAIITLDENGEETTIPIPYYAKPIPATEEMANYISSEGNFFNILGGQFIYGDDLSTYGMFTCEEDAAANMRLTKYVKPVKKAQ